MKYALNRAFRRLGYQVIRTETLSGLEAARAAPEQTLDLPEARAPQPVPLLATHHSAFRHFRPWSGAVPAGMQPTLTGSLIRDEFYGSPISPGRWVDTTFPSAGEDFFEWADLLEAVVDAGPTFTMAELGAGYGRWCVAGACAARCLGKVVKLIAVEAEPSHFAMLEQHFRDNGLDPADHRILEAAINGSGGEVSFAVGHPTEWYGQAIIAPGSGFGDWPEGREVRLPAIRLEEALAGVSFLDLIDMDIQGAEAEVVTSSLDLLNQRVRRLHIGTHSHEVEDQIYGALISAGWKCQFAFRTGSAVETMYGPVHFIDGSQSWFNSRLSDGETSGAKTVIRC